MTTRKTVYTPEVTAQLTAEYQAAQSAEGRQAVMEAFAEKLEVKVASVRAKLVREEVYVKPERETKRKATKAELVTMLANEVGTQTEKLESLEKATAKALTVVLEALKAREAPEA